jgi:hypothetical protein
MTYTELTQKHNINYTRIGVYSRPDGLMDDQPMNHYKFRITCGKRGFTLYFSQGLGIHTEATMEDVLDCVASDASGYENARSFEDWANELGYDPDSRKVERIYRAVKRQAEQLKRTIGEDAYNELLWNTERL